MKWQQIAFLAVWIPFWGMIAWRLRRVRHYRRQCGIRICGLAELARLHLTNCQCAGETCYCGVCDRAMAMVDAASRATAVFNTVSEWEMVWKFWRPVRSFYPGMPWAEHRRQVTWDYSPIECKGGNAE